MTKLQIPRQTAWLLSLFCLTLPSIAYGQTLHNKAQPESAFQVTAGDGGVTLTAPGGKQIAIAWKELTRVVVRTTDEGPLKPDFFWQLFTDKRPPAIQFPQGTTGEMSFLKVLQRRLPGFNNHELVRASSSTVNAEFLLWMAPAPPPAPPTATGGTGRLR